MAYVSGDHDGHAPDGQGLLGQGLDRIGRADAGAGSGRRVLLIEDEYFIADGIARALQASGDEVVGPVATVGEALALIARNEQLDGAVLDINLRGEMVYPVADALAARGIPFIFATGYDGITIPPRYADVIRCQKPVDPARLARSLFGAAGRR